MRWGALLPLILTPAVAAADEVRILYLKQRPAEEIIPDIRPLLGPDDAVSGTDYRLIIHAPSAKLKEIECILPQLDVVRRQLRITVQQGVSTDDAAAQSLSGETRVGKARVTLPEKSGDDRGLVAQKDELRYSTSKPHDLIR